MAQHTHHVERVETDNGAGTATGMIVGILLVLLVAILALFYFFGGPARFGGTPAPGQTNVNVPQQQAPPQSPPQGGTNIQVPRQIDVNVNQPQPAQPAQPPQAPTGGGS